jgi:hypothetical protein
VTSNFTLSFYGPEVSVIKSYFRLTLRLIWAACRVIFPSAPPTLGCLRLKSFDLTSTFKFSIVIDPVYSEVSQPKTTFISFSKSLESLLRILNLVSTMWPASKSMSGNWRLSNWESVSSKIACCFSSSRMELGLLCAPTITD